MTENAKNYHEKMFPGYVSDFLRTDPEFIEAFDNFAFDEVINHDNLDDRIRFISILATLIGCQGIDEFKGMLLAAYNFGVTPVEMKEIVYQAVAYLGIGRVFPFLKALNTFLEETLKITLPLEKQGTTKREDRLEKGEQAQIDIFGESMKGYAFKGPEETKHINYWLTVNCFGDYYTRTGLNKNERELITFCFLFAQGDCKPQLKAHIQANIQIGNDQQFLINIVSQNVPYIGYPRSLNALQCILEAK